MKYIVNIPDTLLIFYPINTCSSLNVCTSQLSPNCYIHTYMSCLSQLSFCFKSQLSNLSQLSHIRQLFQTLKISLLLQLSKLYDISQLSKILDYQLGSVQVSYKQGNNLKITFKSNEISVEALFIAPIRKEDMSNLELVG